MRAARVRLPPRSATLSTAPRTFQQVLAPSSAGHAIKRFNSFSRACDGLLSVCLELLGPVWSRPSKGATWPPRARYVARVALCQGGGWIALPHPRLMSKSRSRWPATFCARGRQPPVEKFGRLEHLSQKEHPKSDVWHPCIGGLSRRVHGSGPGRRALERAELITCCAVECVRGGVHGGVAFVTRPLG